MQPQSSQDEGKQQPPAGAGAAAGLTPADAGQPDGQPSTPEAGGVQQQQQQQQVSQPLPAPSGGGGAWEQLCSVREAHSGDVNCVRWNPADPSMLASAGDDGLVKIWRLHKPSAGE